MTFLYLSGTTLTLTRHDWNTWEFGRNVVFNLFGFALLLHGFRAMWLRNRPDVPRPALLDRLLLGQLVLTVAVMVALAVPRDTPLRMFALIGIGLVALEARDWHAGLTAQRLHRRHVRYMLGSFFYLLTVVSLVHLREELSRDERWLWPAALGTVVAGIAATRPARARATVWSVRVALVVTLALAGYAGWELLRGEAPSGGMQEPPAARGP
jgi:hypothetical protein